MFRIALLLLIIIVLPVIAQANDTIRIDRKKSNVYYVGEKKMTKSEIKDLLRTDDETDEMVSSSNAQKTWGWIILSGGLLFTLDALYEGAMYSNNYPDSPFNSTSFVMGTVLALGLDLAGLMLLSESSRTFRRAIMKYNKIIKTTEVPLRFYFTGIRLGISVNLD